MKNKVFNHIHGWLFICLAAVLVTMSACEDDTVSKPTVSSVRNYAAFPEDTLITVIKEGQWVVIEGKNLSSVSQIYFNSVPASLNSALFSDKSIVVQIPSIPFPEIPASEQNKIVVVNAGGEFVYNIDVRGNPLISKVREYAEAPNDTVIHSVIPGQMINIVGYNLKDATEITFMGIRADLNTVVYTDTSAIVQVPVDLSGGDATKVDLINYTTLFGTGAFSIKIIGPPVITAVSNENPMIGTSVTLYGTSFVDVQTVTFAGETITDFEVAEDEKSISFIVTTLTQSGPVVVETLAGTFTTAFNVNDVRTGIISDYEWGNYFAWEWWGGASLASNSPDYPGNTTQYITLKTINLDVDGGANWSTAIRVGDVQWVAVDYLDEPLTNWALKFEMSIPEDWDGASLCITSGYNETVMYRYEPWYISTTKTAPYKTNGWQTVVVPLSEFRKEHKTLGDGKGDPLGGEVRGLVGPTGKSKMILYLHNYGTAPTKTGFKGAFDNVRVVRR